MHFTLDLEYHRGEFSPDGRYVANTRRILEYLDRAGVRGTFFIVGRIAEAIPDLIREIARLGHEIACHSYDHTPLDREQQKTFREKTYRAKSLLEDSIGHQVIGYRPPIFSLTPVTVWATDSLAELGFRYSSSVLPVWNPLYGFPGAPLTAFCWPNGLIEIPVPVAPFLGRQIPFLGGIYLRYSPSSGVLRKAELIADWTLLWTYLHPYDFDAEEKFVIFPWKNVLVSTLLWFNRKHTFEKLSAVLSLGVSAPLAETI
jgi:peptidoglycan-N-acetylglucosamine deacetylase